MNILFLKWQILCLFFGYGILLNFYCKNDKNTIVVSTETKKKVRKVDISILRENLINQFIILLQLVEKTLNTLLKESKKESFLGQSQEVMKIFNWVNECIAKFNDDSTLYGRSEIESYLNQAQKYTLFLNNI